MTEHMGAPSGDAPALATAEPVEQGQVPSAEDLAWEGQGWPAPPRPGDVPVLRVEGFEGPLDWLLEQARAGRVDLARLPMLALVAQCVTALEAALARLHDTDSGAPPIPLQRLADWVTMAAWLAELRSRLLLPADDPDAAAAREDAARLRRQLADRAQVRDVVAWLDAQSQLGRDVFARGGPPARAANAERAVDLPALLGAYARLVQAFARRIERASVCQPRPAALWRVSVALAHLHRLLAEQRGGAATAGQEGGTSLWRFLPDAAALEAAGLAPGAVPDAALLSRSAAASTFVAGLELAREGRLALAQTEGFGAIDAHGVEIAPDGQEAGAATGDIPTC